MKSLVILLMAAAIGFTGCRDDPETLVRRGYDEKVMDQAIARARQETDEFIKALEAKSADSFSVKAPITDAKGTEHFWITDVRYENGVSSGTLRWAKNGRLRRQRFPIGCLFAESESTAATRSIRCFLSWENRRPMTCDGS